MIRKALISTAAVLALCGTAFAADLPSRAAPPVFVAPLPVFSWTGFYIGGQAGYAFGEDRRNNNLSHPKGAIGGAHVGYNFAGLPGIGGLGGGLGLGGLVFGAEADIDGTDYRDVAGTTTLSSHVQGSARARVGFAVDRALFYATGGAAFTQFQTNYFNARLPNSFSHTRVGYIVGGGMEYAITTQWSLRAQYTYSDFGTYTDPLAGTGANGRRRETMQKAQIGFSYKFDTPAAVVARY